MNKRRICAIVICSAIMGIFASGQQTRKEEAKPIIIKVGHVNHDHQLALYAALDNAGALGKKTGIEVKPIKDRELYDLFDSGRRIAEVEVVKVGGGSKMPTSLAQNVIDIGFGAAVASLAAVDNGMPIRIISPLHSKGNMLAVRSDIPASNWMEFASYVKQRTKPIRIGYKEPIAVAKMAIESAFKDEGISFSGDMFRKDIKVHMINVKGGEKLNSSLASGLIDGYAGNNPFPAIGLEQGMLKIVCSLDNLSGGKQKDMPCCCIAASQKALEEKKEAIICLMVLFIQGTELVNTDLDSAVKSACRWLGTSEKVERTSIPTSCYSMTESKEWHASMAKWIETMNELKEIKGKLKGMKEPDVAGIAYDFSLLHNAEKRLAK